MKNKIKFKLRSETSKPIFIFSIVFLILFSALLLIFIFTDASWHIIPFVVIFLLMSVWCFLSALGDKIIVDNLRCLITFKKGVHSWKRIIRKKVSIKFDEIIAINYKIYEKADIGGGWTFGYSEPFEKWCEEKEMEMKDRHMISFILISGEIYECYGVANSRKKGSNGQWVDITEEKTREVVGKLNTILNEWREKNEVQSLQEGNLSDNIETVQGRENEDTEQSTE